MQAQADATLRFDDKTQSFFCEGAWLIHTLGSITLPNIKQTAENFKINGADLTALDSAGAVKLYEIFEASCEQPLHTCLVDFSDEHQALLDLVASNTEFMTYYPPTDTSHSLLYRVGQETHHKAVQAKDFITLLGELSYKFVDILGHWQKFRLPSIASNLYSTGLQALPIVGLLAFLIGVVLAYQMGLQLQAYGANSFIAYLSGMAIFREFAPLITAIIVAGRTSSAFTAQIGSMMVNEEVDALKTMGLSPNELLVMPKVLALLLVFPLLIFWADFFSLLGAMFMSHWKLGVGYGDFLWRIKDTVGLKQLLLGLYKAPAFALIVSLVGCFQGFLVKANADSIGSQTTRSVVQALFLIIIADAAFSIIYSWMGL